MAASAPADYNAVSASRLLRLPSSFAFSKEAAMLQTLQGLHVSDHYITAQANIGLASLAHCKTPEKYIRNASC